MDFFLVPRSMVYVIILIHLPSLNTYIIVLSYNKIK